NVSTPVAESATTRNKTSGGNRHHCRKAPPVAENATTPVAESATTTSGENRHTTKTIINTINNNPPIVPPVAEPAAEALGYLNTELAILAASRGERKPSGFKPTAQTLSAIGARLQEYTVEDCRRVVDYLIAKWGNDQKMADYLRPSTIFRPTNFAEYVALSDAWDAKGRPRCQDGYWVFADGRMKPMSNVPDPFNPPKNRKLVVDRRWSQPLTEESPYALSNFA
ncbi:conserved phage C-terminal domain-containing protein, partial [Testudinibacter sp. TR-2022]